MRQAHAKVYSRAHTQDQETLHALRNAIEYLIFKVNLSQVPTHLLLSIVRMSSLVVYNHKPLVNSRSVVRSKCSLGRTNEANSKHYGAKSTDSSLFCARKSLSGFFCSRTKNGKENAAEKLNKAA
jgi:hypothetical protein